MTEFVKNVIKVVRVIPVGKVVSYGQVAAYVGVPRAARAVGWVLNKLDDESIPWWRVINNSGRISIKGNWQHEAVEQSELLRQEGVNVRDFKIDMKRYRYLATEVVEFEYGPGKYKTENTSGG